MKTYIPKWRKRGTVKPVPKVECTPKPRAITAQPIGFEYAEGCYRARGW